MYLTVVSEGVGGSEGFRGRGEVQGGRGCFRGVFSGGGCFKGVGLKRC